MGSEVTGTCYPEAQLSWETLSSQEQEFEKQAVAQKKKLTEISENIFLEVALLSAMERDLIQTGRSEETLKERCLEAVSCGCKTVKELCLVIYPELDEGSDEMKRAMKSTSMLLMRLKKAELVDRRLGKTQLEYLSKATGSRTLKFHEKKAAETERKRITQEQIKKCVKLNEEMIPEIQRMRMYNNEIMKKLKYPTAAETAYQTYGNVGTEFTLRMTELQRAISDGGDDSHIDTFIESTKSLLKLGTVETYMYDVWRMILEEQKRSKAKL